MAERPAEPDSNKILAAIAQDEQMHRLVVAGITQEVFDRHDARTARARNVAIGVASVALAGILAVGGVLLESVLGARIEAAVNESFSASFDRRLIDLERRTVDVAARSLRNADSFSDSEANYIIQKIESIYDKAARMSDVEDRAASLTALEFAVESAILSFAQAGRVDFISEVEQKAPEVSRGSQNVPFIIVAALGDHLLRDARAPQSWQESLAAEYAKYQQYSKLARSKGYPEISLLYELLTTFVRRDDDPAIAGLIEDLSDLNDNDQAGFLSRVVEILSRLDGSAASGREARILRRFLDRFGGESALLREARMQADTIEQLQAAMVIDDEYGSPDGRIGDQMPAMEGM